MRPTNKLVMVLHPMRDSYEACLHVEPLPRVKHEQCDPLLTHVLAKGNECKYDPVWAQTP